MNDSGTFSLPQDVRDLIEADRNSAEPSGAIKNDIARQLESDLGMGRFALGMAPIAVAAARPPMAQPAALGRTPSILGWKIAATAAISMAIGAGTVPLLFSRTQHPAMTVERTASAPAARVLDTPAPTAEVDGTVVATPAAGPAQQQLLTGKPSAERGRATERVGENGRGSSDTALHATDRLREERAVLDAALRALAMRDGPGALDAIRNHEQLFGRGQLVQERESMRVQALVLARDCAGARAAAARFRKNYSHSIFGIALDKALGGCGG